MQAELDEIIDFLASVPLLSSLEENELSKLAAAVTRLDLNAGQNLFNAGEPTDGLYFLASGKIQLITREKNIETGRSEVLMSGDWAGEESLRAEAERKSTASALTDCILYFLDNHQVQEFLLDNPRFRETYKVIYTSRKMAERLPLSWLQKDERIFLMTRKHPIFLLLNILWPILTFGTVMALLVIFGQAWAALASVVLTAAFTLCGLWLAWNINNWANDFYVITNKRLVWVEHVSGFYDSRQEAPLGTLLSVGIQTTISGSIYKYSDISLRTYVGNIRFNRIANAPIVAKLIEVYWKKSKTLNTKEEAGAMRAALQQKLRAATELPPDERLPEETPEELSQKQPAEVNFFQWLFHDFLRIHIEEGDIITYRRHWLVLLQRLILPLVGLVVALIFLIGTVTWNFTGIPYKIGVAIGFFLTVAMLYWLVYRYIDWRDDMFQLTPDQVIDIDRKPFGRESRRTAPLENILSIEYERRGILPMLFNYGTVYITVGNTQLTFNDVSHPADVQQQIFSRMGAHAEELRQREIEEERERMAEWFKVYREESQSQDTTKQLRTPPL